MPDYKKMYITLLDEMDKTIERFKNILNEAEEVYIESSHNNKAEERAESNMLTLNRKSEVDKFLSASLFLTSKFIILVVFCYALILSEPKKLNHH